MPFYEYRCTQEHVFDVRQSFNDEPVAACPKCGSPAQRVIQAVGVVFKGGGWYATDSRKSSSHTVPVADHDDNHADKLSTSTEGGSSETKEAAPASTSTTAPTPASTSTPSTSKSSGDAAPSK